MSKRTLVAAAALAVSAALGSTASASGIGIGGIPFLEEIKESTHPCGGAIDYACKDGTGAFCTIWLGRCTVGE